MTRSTAPAARLSALLAGAVLAGGLGTCPPAYAQFSDNEARRALLELRQQLRETTEQNEKITTQLTEQNRQARLQLANHIENLQAEVASLRGQLEQLRWEFDAARRIEQQAIGVTTTVNNPQEQAAFNQAITHFRSGRYPQASEGFSTFLAQYPNSQLATEALFYQGSSQYANHQFDASILTLQSLVQGRPNHTRAPDALLIIAANQVEKGDLQTAKTTLQAIIDGYPQSTAAQTAQERMELLR